MGELDQKQLDDIRELVSNQITILNELQLRCDYEMKKPHAMEQYELDLIIRAIASLRMLMDLLKPSN